MRIVRPVISMVTLVYAGLVQAQQKSDVQGANFPKCLAAVTGEILDSADAEKAKKQSEDFKELGFGGGYGSVINLGERNRIEEAAVVDGVVRIVKDNDVQFGPLLEMHKFIKPLKSQFLIKQEPEQGRAGQTTYRLTNQDLAGCRAPEQRYTQTRVDLVSLGPFVTLRIGGNEVVQSFGIGLMVGFRTALSDKSLNLGVALASDPTVRVLGDGLEPGQPLPSGETELRYRTTHRESVMVLFSVGW